MSSATALEVSMKTGVQDRRRVYWHRDLPPLTAEVMAEHTVEADSSRVKGTLAHRGELWGRCHGELMTRAEARLIQEIVRLGGHYAHVYDESIVPKRDAGSGESWLHGRFTYVLYRRTLGCASPIQ